MSIKKSSRKSEFVRYVANGLFATFVNFLVLTLLMEVNEMQSAAVAGFVAAVVGISTSFVGSRYFVFQSFNSPISYQVTRFFALYILLAGLTGAVLYCVSDLMGFDYRYGFFLATILQFLLSYVGNRRFVFK